METLSEQLKTLNDALRLELIDPVVAAQEGWQRRTNADGSPSAWVRGTLQGIAPEAEIGPDVVIFNRSGGVVISPINRIDGNTRIFSNVLIDQSRITDAEISGNGETRYHPVIDLNVVGITQIVESTVDGAVVRQGEVTASRVMDGAVVNWSILDSAEVSGPGTAAHLSILEPGSSLLNGARAFRSVLQWGVTVDQPVDIDGEEVDDSRYTWEETEQRNWQRRDLGAAAQGMKRSQPETETPDGGRQQEK